MFINDKKKFNNFFFSAQVLKDDVVKHKAQFQTAENAGQKLIERSQEDPAVVADVYSKLYKARTELDKLLSRADQRLSRVQHALLQSQEFKVSFDDFLEKLGKLEESYALQVPVSGVYDTVKEQSQEQKVRNASTCCDNYQRGQCFKVRTEGCIRCESQPVVKFFLSYDSWDMFDPILS